MLRGIAAASILAGALMAGGCATKKYVRNTVTPVQAKVDQVGEQTNRNSQGIEETKQQVKQVDDRAQSGISAAQERAGAADTRAGDALTRAGNAQQSADKAGQSAEEALHGVGNLRSVVANLDDYKLQASATIPFAFDRYTLDAQARQELDRIAGEMKNGKRYFIAVEGFTDHTGSHQYNEALSRKRADSVVQYMVVKHDIPLFRIHMIGLGDQKPADDARNRAARAKNRRVEVKVFSADQVLAGLSESQGAQGQTAASTTPVRH